MKINLVMYIKINVRVIERGRHLNCLRGGWPCWTYIFYFKSPDLLRSLGDTRINQRRQIASGYTIRLCMRLQYINIYEY